MPALGLGEAARVQHHSWESESGAWNSVGFRAWGFFERLRDCICFTAVAGMLSVQWSTHLEEKPLGSLDFLYACTWLDNTRAKLRNLTPPLPGTDPFVVDLRLHQLLPRGHRSQGRSVSGFCSLFLSLAEAKV